MKALDEMTAEVVACNTERGWYNDGVPQWPDYMFLLHSEVAEAGEAWRNWGLADHTCPGHVHTHGYGSKLCKPEGVGSEFADILIRLLGDAYLFGGHDLATAVKRAGRFGLYGSFPANMNMMHSLIARLSAAGEGSTAFGGVEDLFGSVYLLLQQFCEVYGVNLQAEYERKMAYNRTRPYRHGGKAL